MRVAKRWKWKIVGERLGLAASATEVQFETVTSVNQLNSLGVWFIHAEHQSPISDHYLLALMHLREVPGAFKPHRQNVRVTHEIALVMLSPETSPTIEPWTWSFLRPVNFDAQVELPSDDVARGITSWLAQDVCDGKLWAEPPMATQIEPWATTVAQRVASMA